MRPSDHDFRLIAEAYLDGLSAEALREVSKRLCQDLQETRERLNQPPEYSSHPPSTRAPWTETRSETEADEHEVEPATSILTEGEAARIIAVCDNPKHRMLLTLCYGGARHVSELVAVEVRHIVVSAAFACLWVNSRHRFLLGRSILWGKNFVLQTWCLYRWLTRHRRRAASLSWRVVGGAALAIASLLLRLRAVSADANRGTALGESLPNLS